MEVATGKVVAQFFQKTMSKESWPALQFSSDETLLAHMVNNTVNIYSVQAFANGEGTMNLQQKPRVKCLLEALKHQRPLAACLTTSCTPVA